MARNKQVTHDEIARRLDQMLELLQSHSKEDKERFERLHRQEPDETGAVPLPLAWFDTFRRDVQEALLAELETRLQPVLGMIDALHQDTKLSS